MSRAKKWKLIFLPPCCCRTFVHFSYCFLLSPLIKCTFFMALWHETNTTNVRHCADSSETCCEPSWIKFQNDGWWMIRNRWIIKLLGLLAFATVDEIKKFDRTETASFDPVSMFNHQRDFELGDHQLSDTLVVVYKISFNRLISSILKHAIQMLKATNGFYLLLIFLLIILPFYLLSLRLFTPPQTSFIT